MSRYTAAIVHGYELAWGFDEPNSEYFIQLFDPEEECVFSIANYWTTQYHPEFPRKARWSNGELLEIFQRYADVVPAEHIQALVSDLPF